MKKNLPPVIFLAVFLFSFSSTVIAQEPENTFSDYIYGVCLEPTSQTTSLSGGLCRKSDGYIMVSNEKHRAIITNSNLDSPTYQFASIKIPYDSVTLDDIKSVPESSWYSGSPMGYTYGATTTVFRHKQLQIYGKAVMMPTDLTTLGLFQIITSDS